MGIAGSKPVLVKIGGAVLTEKDGVDRIRRAAAKRIAGELAKAGVPLVVIHGAGSFGHPHVAGSKLGKEPLPPHERPVVSTVLTHVMHLHLHVLEALETAGLHPVSVPLHLDAESEDGLVTKWPLERIRRLIDEGYTPVLAGTVIRDDELGWRVLSGDEILSDLSGELNPRLCLWLSDVDGVHAGPPSEAPLLSTLRPEDDYLPYCGNANGTDVTGGMAEKIRHALLASEVAPTMLISGMERGRILDALKGKPVPGTRFGG